MFQTIIFVGTLGRDPELRFTPEGKPVTSLNVAVDDGYGDKKSTIWFRVSAWGKQAETTNQYLRKGSRVLVEGRLVPDAATGSPRIFSKQDGTQGSSYEVSATTVKFLTPKGEQPDDQPAGEPDSIPF